MRTGTYKESYSQLTALTDNPAVWLWACALIGALVVVPSIANAYVLSLASTVCITALGVLGLNLLSGVAGQISLGHAAFLLIGAYAHAILMTDYGVNGFASILVSGFIAALVSLVVGIPSLRLKGLYLAITTLAFTFIAQHVVLYAEDITRGSAGMSVVPLDLLGFEFASEQRFFYVALGFLVLFVLITLNLMRTRIGRAWLALRDHDIAARAMGINLTRYKLLAFMVSAFYGGVAGALIAAHTRYVNVDTFGVLVSIEALAMIIVGGLGRTHGAILGAALIVLLPEVLRVAFAVLGSDVQALMADRIYEIRGMMYGVVILLFLRLEPEGLAGIWRKSKRFWTQWPLSQ
ncbi:branched-chain amino acid ABC transporter permease [Aromatoleum toluclasticum]|uniref:branched-chain amino acid ABC transporter permease n=1 Tax=Aromatoleum toluclasticum TaxID=92003 RepID=UPI001D18D351|nr:branched-chain amino acid ABC transporter permease [Aromatoleum toluclasticum]MCC4113956.1 branched-chain amino acid ABC transporter permease [Aromatoleum toluclasticum]